MALLVNQKEHSQKLGLEELRIKQQSDALAGKKKETIKANQNSAFDIPKDEQHAYHIVTEHDTMTANGRGVDTRTVVTAISKERYSLFFDKSGDFKNHVFVNAAKKYVIHIPDENAIDPIYAIIAKGTSGGDKTDLELENEELKQKIKELSMVKKPKQTRAKRTTSPKQDTDNNLETK